MTQHNYACAQCGDSKSPSHDSLCSECFVKVFHELEKAENTRVGETLRKVSEPDTQKPKHWGEHFREAVAALTSADAALDDITGWSGGAGNWSAQETHPRVQAALVLLRGKHGDDPRVDAFLAELAKDPK